MKSRCSGFRFDDWEKNFSAKSMTALGSVTRPLASAIKASINGSRFNLSLSALTNCAATGWSSAEGRATCPLRTAAAHNRSWFFVSACGFVLAKSKMNRRRVAASSIAPLSKGKK